MAPRGALASDAGSPGGRGRQQTDQTSHPGSACAISCIVPWGMAVRTGDLSEIHPTARTLASVFEGRVRTNCARPSPRASLPGVHPRASRPRDTGAQVFVTGFIFKLPDGHHPEALGKLMISNRVCRTERAGRCPGQGSPGLLQWAPKDAAGETVMRAGVPWCMALSWRLGPVDGPHASVSHVP